MDSLIEISNIKIGARFRKDMGDLRSLADSIEDIGLLQPVGLTRDFELIWGHRRLEAFKLLSRGSIPCRIIDIDDKVHGEYAENEIRKDFTVSERAAISEEKKRRLSKRNGSNQDKRRHEEGCQNFDNPPVIGRSDDEAAKAGGFGNRQTMRQAQYVVNHGSTALIGAMDEEQASISVAADIATLPANQQDIIVGLGEKAILMAAKEIRAKKKKARREELSQQRQDYLEAARKEKQKSLPDRCRLIHQDFRIADIADSSLDRIITDPPYGHDYIPVYRDLALFAARTLKPDGVMLVMCGQMWFPEFLRQLTQPELHYQWLMAYLTPGGQSPGLFHRKVNTFWKPVLVFSKGESVSDWFGDVVTSDTNDNDKRFHERGQSESGFFQLVYRFTRPGQTVCDPFMGAGTTLLAALQCGCQVVGIECDELAFHKASERLQETINHV